MHDLLIFSYIHKRNPDGRLSAKDRQAGGNLNSGFCAPAQCLLTAAIGNEKNIVCLESDVLTFTLQDMSEIDLDLNPLLSIRRILAQNNRVLPPGGRFEILGKSQRLQNGHMLPA